MAQFGSNLLGAALNAYSRRPVVIQPQQQRPQQSLPAQPVYFQQAANSRGRGRGRGRRGRGARARQFSPRAGPISTPGGGTITVVDSETLTYNSKKITVLTFNPASTALPRLSQYEKMYARYRILYMDIKYVPTTSAATTGSITFCVIPGPVNNTITTQDAILKCRPMRSVAIWQGATLPVSQTIDSQKFLYCGGSTEDGVAFVLYVWGDADPALGYFNISYKVQFAYPKPF